MVQRSRYGISGFLLAGAAALVCGSLRADAEIWDLRTAVTAFANTLDFEIGSVGNQSPGDNPAIPCPGAVPGGTEDVYDFGQDGVPDYAQMALIESMYFAGDPTVRTAVDSMAHALRTKPITVSSNAFRGTELEGFEFLINLLRLNLPSLLEQVIVTFGLIDLPEGVGETRAERDILYTQAIDGIVLWGCIDNPGNLGKLICVDETVGVVMGVLTGLYDPAVSNLNHLVGGDTPLGDGTTVLDRWNATEALFPDGVKMLATDNEPFLRRVDAFLAEVQGVVPGDINGDGVVNAIDVQLVINASLGRAIPSFARPDISANGTVNAVDVQLVVNAALGMDIRAQLQAIVKGFPANPAP